MVVRKCAHIQRTENYPTGTKQHLQHTRTRPHAEWYAEWLHTTDHCNNIQSCHAMDIR